MITEDYVSYKVAKLLKEKEFEQHKCQHSYTSKGEFKWSDDLDPYECAAPTLQTAMKWLRETHSIAIEPMLLSHGWFCQIEKILEDFCKEYIDETDSYKTYEEAVEAALKCVLKNII